MSFRIPFYTVLTVSALALTACGGGGGDDSGGDGGGGTAKTVLDRKDAFATGVWRQYEEDQSGAAQASRYLVHNDGTNVRITNCDLSRPFDEHLTWQTDELISSEDGEFQVKVDSESDISFVIDGFTHRLEATINEGKVTISSPEDKVTEGRDPTCGFISGADATGAQSLAVLTMIGSDLYLLQAGFSKGFGTDKEYTSESENSTLTASVVLMNEAQIERLKTNPDGDEFLSGTSENASVTFSACTEASDDVPGSASADFSGFSGENIAALTGTFTLEQSSEYPLVCGENIETPPEDDPDKPNELDRIDGLYLENIDEGLTLSCDEEGSSGELTGLWKLDDATQKAIRQLGIEDIVEQGLKELVSSVFLVTEHVYDETPDSGADSRIGIALCQATTPDLPEVEFRYAEIERKDNAFLTDTELDGEFDASLFGILTIKDSDTMDVDLSGLGQIPDLVSPKVIRRSPKLGSYCMNAHNAEGELLTYRDSEKTKRSTVADLGCVGGENRDEENLLVINAEINGRLASVFAEFSGPIGKGDFALGQGVLTKVSIKYDDMVEATVIEGVDGEDDQEIPASITEVYNAHFWVDKLNNQIPYLVSIPRAEGRFVLQLEEDDEQYISGKFKSWRWLLD